VPSTLVRGLECFLGPVSAVGPLIEKSLGSKPGLDSDDIFFSPINITISWFAGVSMSW
jgi:hypothetical protein